MLNIFEVVFKGTGEQHDVLEVNMGKLPFTVHNVAFIKVSVPRTVSSPNLRTSEVEELVM